MPDKIKILPSSISNKIAAGEVVGRPESVVKELIENSIDAGADDISVIIRDAGKTLIQIIDNGNGMSEEDAGICFLRHSTSKINVAEDLENITTLGFRGEALASIASISQVELKTKTINSELGTLIRIEGNEIIETTKINCDKGTSVSVKNLFYNTPARRNFLKSNQTEFRHIYETFIRLAISRPEIAFRFFNNEEEIFKLNKTSLNIRLQEIFTKDFSKSLISVNFGNQIINIKGFISKPNFTKKSKQDQYFFLNNRFFTNKALNFAVYSGYDDLIEKGNYPSFFLFIEIDPHKVDVNVHPSKLEVKFEDEGAVFGFIKNSIRDALRKADITFDIEFSNDSKPELSNDNLNMHELLSHKESNITKTEFDNEGRERIKTPEFSNKDEKYQGAKITSIFEAIKQTDNEKSHLENETIESNIFEHKKSETDIFNIWQYQNKYIMCQTEVGLMIIDQHAAHERILYEKALLWLESQASFSQQLLIPIKIQLTKIDYQIATVIQEELKSLGFNFKLLKNEIVEIIGLPSDVKIGDENKIFQELIDQYKEYELKLKLEKRDNLAKSFSCRGAIKSGDSLSRPEMISLIDNLFSAKLPYVCPHGRPTMIRISTEELDKRFSRT